MKKLIIGLIILLTSLTGNAKEENMSKSKVLIAYFSRTGEQYTVGEISKGNTAIVAEMIAKKTGGDLFEIKVKNDTYPTKYKPLTEVAKEEQKANARPEIIGSVPNFADYDVVFLGTPNWWADMPMPVYTFLEQYNWNGKKIAPFVTHEGSGLSSIPESIKKVTKAEVLKGFSLYGHEAQNEREESEIKVDDWLKKLGF